MLTGMALTNPKARVVTEYCPESSSMLPHALLCSDHITDLAPLYALANGRPGPLQVVKPGLMSHNPTTPTARAHQCIRLSLCRCGAPLGLLQRLALRPLWRACARCSAEGSGLLHICDAMLALSIPALSATQGLVSLRGLCVQFLAWDQEARNKVMAREKGKVQNAIVAHQFDHNVSNQVGLHCEAGFYKVRRGSAAVLARCEMGSEEIYPRRSSMSRMVLGSPQHRCARMPQSLVMFRSCCKVPLQNKCLCPPAGVSLCYAWARSAASGLEQHILHLLRQAQPHSNGSVFTAHDSLMRFRHESNVLSAGDTIPLQSFLDLGSGSDVVRLAGLLECI